MENAIFVRRQLASTDINLKVNLARNYCNQTQIQAIPCTFHSSLKLFQNNTKLFTPKSNQSCKKVVKSDVVNEGKIIKPSKHSTRTQHTNTQAHLVEGGRNTNTAPFARKFVLNKRTRTRTTRACVRTELSVNVFARDKFEEGTPHVSACGEYQPSKEQMN